MPLPSPNRATMPERIRRTKKRPEKKKRTVKKIRLKMLPMTLRKKILPTMQESLRSQTPKKRLAARSLRMLLQAQVTTIQRCRPARKKTIRAKNKAEISRPIRLLKIIRKRIKKINKKLKIKIRKKGSHRQAIKKKMKSPQRS